MNRSVRRGRLHGGEEAIPMVALAVRSPRALQEASVDPLVGKPLSTQQDQTDDNLPCLSDEQCSSLCCILLVFLVLFIFFLLIIGLYTWSGVLQDNKVGIGVWDDIEELRRKTQNMDATAGGLTTFAGSVAVDAAITAAQLVIGADSRRRDAMVPANASRLGGATYVLRGGALFAWNDTELEYFDVVAAMLVLYTRVTTLETNNTALEERVGALETEAAAAAAATFALSERVLVLETTISALTSNDTSLIMQIVSLQSNVTTLDSRTSALETNTTALQAAVTTIQSDVTTIQSNVTTITQTLASLSSQIDSKLTFNGSWSAVPTYPRNYLVTHNGSFWISLETNVNSAPTVTNGNWTGWSAQSGSGAANATGAYSGGLNVSALPAWNASLNTPYVLPYTMPFTDSVPGMYISPDGNFTLPPGQYSFDISVRVYFDAGMDGLTRVYMWIQDSTPTVLRESTDEAVFYPLPDKTLNMDFIAEFTGTTTLTIYIQIYSFSGNRLILADTYASTLSIKEHLV